MGVHRPAAATGTFYSTSKFEPGIDLDLYSALQQLIHRDNIPGGDYVYFGVASNRLDHAYNYRRLRAEEWLAGGDRVNEILEQLSQVLNSNENIEMDDSFQLTFTRVRAPSRGSGKRKMRPGHRHPKRSNGSNKLLSPLITMIICAVPGRSSRPKQNWTNTQTGMASKREQRFKRPKP